MDAEKKMNKDLIKKYLGWERIKFNRNDWDGSLVVAGEIPIFDDGHGKRAAHAPSLDAFTQSIDSCYREIVPKLPKGTEVVIYQTESEEIENAWGCYINDYHNYQVGASPPWALCRALLTWRGQILKDTGSFVGVQWAKAEI